MDTHISVLTQSMVNRQDSFSKNGYCHQKAAFEVVLGLLFGCGLFCCLFSAKMGGVSPSIIPSKVEILWVV